MRDLGSYITIKRIYNEVIRTATPTAVVIDRGGSNSNLYEGVVLGFYAGIGGITFDGSNNIALKLEDSDDNVTFANVTAAGSVVLGMGNLAGVNYGQVPDANGYVRLINTAKAAVDTDPFKVAYVGNKRYLRPTIVFTGTHGTGTIVGLNAVLGFPQQLPTLQ